MDKSKIKYYIMIGVGMMLYIITYTIYPQPSTPSIIILSILGTGIISLALYMRLYNTIENFITYTTEKIADVTTTIVGTILDTTEEILKAELGEDRAINIMQKITETAVAKLTLESLGIKEDVPDVETILKMFEKKKNEPNHKNMYL